MSTTSMATTEFPAFARLIDAWRTIYGEGSAQERSALNKVLGDVLAGVGDEWGRGSAKDTRRTLELFVALALSSTTSTSSVGGLAGEPAGAAVAAGDAASPTEPRYFVHELRPAWLSDALFAAFRAEAAERHAGRRLLGACHANEQVEVGGSLLRAPGFVDWLCTRARLPREAFEPDVALSYLYYAKGECCPLHLDNPQRYQLNLLVGLEHVPPADPGAPLSYLRIHTPASVDRVDLVPGSVALFRADRLPHARTPLSAGERVTVLTVGIRVRS